MDSITAQTEVLSVSPPPAEAPPASPTRHHWDDFDGEYDVVVDWDVGVNFKHAKYRLLSYFIYKVGNQDNSRFHWTVKSPGLIAKTWTYKDCGHGVNPELRQKMMMCGWMAEIMNGNCVHTDDQKEKCCDNYYFDMDRLGVWMLYNSGNPPDKNKFYDFICMRSKFGAKEHCVCCQGLYVGLTEMGGMAVTEGRSFEGLGLSIKCDGQLQGHNRVTLWASSHGVFSYSDMCVWADQVGIWTRSFARNELCVLFHTTQKFNHGHLHVFGGKKRKLQVGRIAVSMSLAGLHSLHECIRMIYRLCTVRKWKGVIGSSSAVSLNLPLSRARREMGELGWVQDVALYLLYEGWGPTYRGPEHYEDIVRHISRVRTAAQKFYIEQYRHTEQIQLSHEVARKMRVSLASKGVDWICGVVDERGAAL